VHPAAQPRRRRRRKIEATGTVRVAWRAKGPVWVMKYRLPDETESMRVLGPAWVKRDPENPKSWLPRRGRPPEGTLTEDAAASELRRFLDEQTERTPPERIDIERCADAFIAHCEQKGLSPNTMRTYKQIVGEIKSRWQGWRAVDVDADELEDYRDELVENGLAGSTLNQRRAVLSGIFKVARRRFHVNVDPLDGFERAEVKDSGDLEVYSVEEVWALVRTLYSGAHHSTPKRRLSAAELAARSVQDVLDATIVLVAALCGLRRSEILGLRWRAVLLEQRAIVVRRGFTDVGGDRLPKGQRVHSVPMAPQVHDMLVRLQPDQVDPDARVFPGEGGGAMDGSALYRRYKLAQDQAEVRTLRFHDLRHTFGTQAIAGGASVHDVQKWMGHRHLATTMRYVHYQPQLDAAELLGKRFEGTAGELARLLGDPAGVTIPGDSGMSETAS
jgi:integrase